jgi:hypothetical protein
LAAAQIEHAEKPSEDCTAEELRAEIIAEMKELGLLEDFIAAVVKSPASDCPTDGLQRLRTDSGSEGVTRGTTDRRRRVS